MNEIPEWLPVAIKIAGANVTSGYQAYSLFHSASPVCLHSA